MASSHRLSRGEPRRTSSGVVSGLSDPLAMIRSRQSLAPKTDGGESRRVDGVKQGNLGALGIAVLEADAEGIVQEINPCAEQLTGFSRAEARGKLLNVVFPVTDGEDDLHGPLSLGAAAFSAIQPPNETQPFLTNRRGHKRAVTYTVETFPDPESQQIRILILAQDITEERLNALRLMHLAGHDGLTGLLNRQQFIKHVETALTQVAKSQTTASVVFLDIDRFRLINDASGLDAGDNLLGWIASLLREVLGKDDIAARLGGNEFGLLLYDADLRRAEEIAREVSRRLGDFRFAWRDSTFSVRTSAGVIELSPEFDGASAVIGTAERASGRAKEQGGSRVYVWRDAEAAGQAARDQALAWVAHIQDNLKHGHVELYCQPIVPLHTEAGHGLSFEILFRMLDAEGIARGPQDMILMAERYGLMDAIDRWVIRNTLQQLGENRELLRRIDHCSINLSAMSLHQQTILEQIHDDLARTGVPPHKICFEITETAAIDNLSEARWLIQELSSLGCRFSLDDFGSGMASYAYLRELPVDFIKIDRTFVKDVDTTELNAAIVESIVHIANLLNAKTIAEGVETTAISNAITALGLDYGQGYLYGRPRPLATDAG